MKRAAAFFASVVLSAGCLAQGPGRGLGDMSLEELGNLSVTVTSVSGRAERLSDAPASIYVITSEDIRRSGATTLPEVLRLAPNLQVARIDASQYAISARGFNNSIGNKLLVLIDGRTVYTPLFSGVFWEQQDVMLEDVERIEVISGPGSTLWGANAVNGVINVITRPATATQGALAVAGAGNREQGAAFRYGSALGDNGHLRVYGKTSRMQNTRTAAGAAIADGWERLQAGFRADWSSGANSLTLQGDAYSGRAEDRGGVPGFRLGRIEVSGANLLARWTHRFAGGSDLQVQAYVDHSEREDFVLFRPSARTFDLEVKHAVPLGSHRLLWGGGYRQATDDVGPGIFTAILPASRRLKWANVFVQDEFQLARNLELTAGIKLEHNDYTGVEHLPSLRLAWKHAPDRLLWAAASRAVRAPSRIDRDLFVPVTPPFLFVGGPNFEAEIANVLEIGHRARLSPSFSYSLTAFHNTWDRLRSGTAVPVRLENRIEGTSYGLEGWATWQAARDWRLAAGFTTLRKHLRLQAGSTDPTGVNNPSLANDPEFQWTLRSSLNISGNQELDVYVRRIGALPNPSVPAYTALDLRYGWRPRKDLELSLTAANLLDASHPEFNAAPARSEIARAVYLQLRWSQ